VFYDDDNTWCWDEHEFLSIITSLELEGKWILTALALIRFCRE
jgi:hypothetical protein